MQLLLYPRGRIEVCRMTFSSFLQYTTTCQTMTRQTDNQVPTKCLPSSAVSLLYSTVNIRESFLVPGPEWGRDPKLYLCAKAGRSRTHQDRNCYGSIRGKSQRDSKAERHSLLSLFLPHYKPIYVDMHNHKYFK